MIDLLFYAHMLVIPILLPTGIAASQYFHVSRFPNQAAYNEYYNYVVDICDIGVESVATRAQVTLVIICALSTATELPIGVRRSGVMHVAECVLRTAGMMDATTTWELKFHGSTSRSVCRRAAPCQNSSARSATTSGSWHLA